MRFIFDLFKKIGKSIDGYFIDVVGHEITTEDNKKLYGFYTYPSLNKDILFGIDAPDEIEIQFNLKNINVLKSGAILKIENELWKILQRTYLYNRYLGKYRLSVICVRHIKKTEPTCKQQVSIN